MHHIANSQRNVTCFYKILNKPEGSIRVSLSLSVLDEKFMGAALRQARKGLGRTSPNPAVGAVIVRNGKIIASGYHKSAGSGHAEIEALAKIEGRGKKTKYILWSKKDA